MKPIDLTKILKPYKSGWVAVSKDYKKAVAAAATLELLDEELKKLKSPHVVLIPASKNYRGFIT